MSIRDQLKDANDIDVKKIVVPEWMGVDVYVRMLDGKTREKLEQFLSKATSAANPAPTIRATVAAMGLCESDGSPVFDSDNPDDVAELNTRNATALETVVKEFCQYNKIPYSEDETDAAKKN